MAAVDSAIKSAPSTIRTFGASWPLLVAMLAFLGLLASARHGSALLNDADTYWHLAAGRWILENGAVPQSDLFSHSMPGAPWTAHEWLSEVVLAGAFQAAGWTGLVALTALSFAATLAYLTRFLLHRMEPVHALIFAVLAGAMMLGHLLARPHVLVWPLLAVWVGTLVSAGERGAPPPWRLLPLMVLWANLHGSFAMGLALGGALALDAVLSRPAGQRWAAAGPWAGFVALSVAAAALTPWGPEGLLYPFQVNAMTIAQGVIGEWRPPDFQRFQMLELWLLIVLAAACTGRLRLPWLRLLLVLGLMHLALRHQRHVEILGLVAPFLMAAPLASLMCARRETEGGDVEALDRLFHALSPPASAAALAAGALLVAVTTGVALESDRFAPARERAPEAALLAAAKAGVAGDPVFNAYDFGGYLIYRRVPVMIDGRADVYGDTFLMRYLEAITLRDSAALPRLLDEYRIGWTLLEPHGPAVALLDRLPGWRRLYADSVAVVHVRGGAGPAP